MEADLQRYLDTYESTHDYDEYHFDLDTIEHDPYVLISMITALHQGEWTLDEVQGTLQMLFDRQYILGSYTDYDIPPEALDDEVFAAIIKEAEKYLGYPYVWGGSSPSTSFDCSGFVSWVINHSGWDVGRLGAQGLCNICTPVSSANVKPGDLVFFTGTYDTPGVSHVGIYVGNNMMIHCGDPISYANLNSSYWQSNFYRYGRLP